MVDPQLSVPAFRGLALALFLTATGWAAPISIGQFRLIEWARCL